MSMFTLAIFCLTTSITLIHGPNIPGSCAIMFFTASDFIFTTRHIHNYVLFLPWLNLFIPSDAISLLFSSSMLGQYWPGEFLFKCHFLLLFMLFMQFSRQACWSALPFPSPVYHVLSECFTMTHVSYVALHCMAHSFTELVMAVIHVISLVSFLWLCFSFCLPSDGWGEEASGSFRWEGLAVGKMGLALVGGD